VSATTQSPSAISHPQRATLAHFHPTNSRNHDEGTDKILQPKHQDMSSPWKTQPEAVADKVLKRAEVSKVRSEPPAIKLDRCGLGDAGCCVNVCATVA
jgi:hypothetical protein